ncbi:MAG: hypothetical protein Q8K63_06830, partial [Acidimicrobiales bacterium]|nr:hypothetical protein [Acidimicrobiales bacterium]
MSALACPLDLLALERDDGAWRCPSGHSYDVSKEGYVNLLPPGKPSRKESGDDVESIQARRRFLDAGHYAPLAKRLAHLTGELSDRGTILDVGCGEGYYTAQLQGGEVVGVD